MKSDFFFPSSFAETLYSHISNTNRWLVIECTQCDSLPTPSCQGSVFPMCMYPRCNTLQRWGANTEYQTVLFHKSGCYIVFYFETSDKKTKSCLLTMEGGDSVCLQTGRNSSFLCLLELLWLFYRTKRRIEVKLMLARDLNKGWWDGV